MAANYFCSLMEINHKTAAARQKGYKALLKRVNISKTLKLLPQLHQEAFEKTNCLDCAACCKGYSPRFKTTDIKRISRALKLKESDFIEKFLKLDSDGDYVANRQPCPFLGLDNYCSIYDNRPSDCARFPYTSEDVLLKRPQLTLMNSSFCPAVEHVLDRLSQIK